ncbi:MAG: ABC transporter ATP-binding protein [Pseudomonadota bacterium]
MVYENLISAKNISYSYSTAFKAASQKASVDHISFELKRGEILAFLGPNGAGKSTTMRLLTANLSSQSGCIKIAGYDLQKQAQQAKQKIGYLADTPPLYKDLRVNEYLIFCARLHNVSAKDINKALDYVKQRCGLMEYGHRLIAQLSKGVQQRIGIAQAIIHQPDIVILDEPTNGLDPVQRHEILSLIKELGEAHSVLISTHSWSDVQQAGCNKVQIINKGKLVYQDNINNLQQKLHSQNLIVGFAETVDYKKIKLINGIKQIQKNTENSLRIECFESLDKIAMQIVSTAIVELFYQKKWGLYEIYAEKKSFDEVFLSLTQE